MTTRRPARGRKIQKKADQAALEPRKRPAQERSRALVDALVRATARILVRDGWDALSTNRVAREAGVSVGSLYQYFPGKAALVQALAARIAEATAERVASLTAELRGLTARAAAGRIVRAALDLARDEAGLNRAVLLQLPRLGALDAFEVQNRRIADALAEWIAERAGELRVEDPSIAAHVIVTSLDAVTDHALVFRPELLAGRRLERSLERLVLGCLGLPPA